MSDASLRDRSPITFSGRALIALRAVWIALAATTTVLFVLAFPIYWADYIALRGGALELAWVTPWERPDLLAALADIGLSTGAYSALLITMDLLRLAIFLMIGLLIFLRRANEWIGWFTSLFLILFGFMTSSVLRAAYLATNTPIWDVAVLVGNSITWAMFYIFMVIFPDGRPAPRWMRFAIIGYIIGLPALIMTTEITSSPYALVLIMFLVTLSIYAQAYRYIRVSGPLERVQTRWVVLGIFTLMAVIVVAIAIIPALFPQVEEPGSAHILYSLFSSVPVPLAFALIPITLGIAILQYRLWDIDIIIRRTISYSVLTAILAGIYFGVVTLLQAGLASLIGGEGTLAVVISTLAIAALFRPVRARVQRVVDRRFFRQRYDASRVLADFADAVRDEIDVQDVEAALMHAVDQTMQPESVGLWLREGAG